jgi:radical SAM protein with 4Fe4S-binding SPASM domain
MSVKHCPGPLIAVWELTLACNAACIHCGSSAGKPRARELNPVEALELADTLVRLGVSQVTLSGGEPLLRKDWSTIAARLVRAGVTVDMISNGIALDANAAATIAETGLASVTLSVDGPPAIHDRLRGVQGGFDKLAQAVRRLRENRICVGAATQISTQNVEHLGSTEALLVEMGFDAWQLQLTDPLGRVRDHPGLTLPPTAVPAVIEFILQVAAGGRIGAYAADNIGWMLPCEPELRSQRRPPDRFFAGCQAGLSVVGITSDGTIRGCLSMPTDFDEGNVRERSLEEIWNDPNAFPYNRRFDEACLQGGCAACAFRRVCRGGCKSQAYAATGATHRNPYCARA